MDVIHGENNPHTRSGVGKSQCKSAGRKCSQAQTSAMGNNSVTVRMHKFKSRMQNYHLVVGDSRVRSSRELER